MGKSKVARSISYVLIPILVLIIIISIFYETGKSIFYKEIDKENYFNSDEFLAGYMQELSYETSKLIYENETCQNIEDGNFKICYRNNIDDFYENLNQDQIKDFYYLIIYNNIALTNVELTENTNTLEKIKSFITSNQGKKANIVNGVVDSDSEIISNKAIKYFDYFDINYYSTEKKIEDLKGNNTPEIVYEGTREATVQNVQTETPESAGEATVEELKPEVHEEIINSYQEGSNQVIEYRKYNYTSIKDYQIYSSYKEELLPNENNLAYRNIIDSLRPFETILIYSIPVCSTLIILIIIYLIISIGHTKNKEGIDLNDFDKIPIEIILLGLFTIMGICISPFLAYMNSIRMYNENNLKFLISLFLLAYFVTYIVSAITCVSIIKRIKAKKFIETSFTGKFCKWCIRLIKNGINECIKLIKKVIKACNDFTKNTLNSWNILVKIIILLSIYIFFILAFQGFGIFIDLLITIYILYKFVEKINCYKKIENHLKELYEGNHKGILNYQEFTPEFQNMVKYINDISNGFEMAIQEGIKSERLKTELITNVSHDIKTPLTSIINYVDLLKKEDIQGEKPKEYIEVLDKKSQRLKKLTEDLVEASKASSGNVKLNMEKINISELVKQTTGEFEDKFKSKNLDIITSFPKEMIYINADNRYMYRIIENLFSNISKYALENSRVYIDVITKNNKVKIYIKNISKEKLNITAEELMQRFVRGDKSRTTEGSGLGISISKSLTEIQKGKFELQVDGDLFKVELEFDIAY